MKKLMLVISVMLLSGCASVINNSIKDINVMWEKENSQNYRTKIYDRSYEEVFVVMTQTFTDLEMNIVDSSKEKGYIKSRNAAPSPLSKDEWNRVRLVENPKLREISMVVTLLEEPEDQYVVIVAYMKKVNSGIEISYKYFIDVPEMTKLGLVPLKGAPPLAVKIITEKFWKQFDINLG